MNQFNSVYNVSIYNDNKNRALYYNIGQSSILVNQGDATSFWQVISCKNKVIIKSFFQQTDGRQI